MGSRVSDGCACTALLTASEKASCGRFERHSDGWVGIAIARPCRPGHSPLRVRPVAAGSGAIRVLEVSRLPYPIIGGPIGLQGWACSSLDQDALAACRSSTSWPVLLIIITCGRHPSTTQRAKCG